MSSFSDRGNLYPSHRTSPYREKGSILGKHDSAAVALTIREARLDVKQLRLSIASAKRFGKDTTDLESQLRLAEFRLRELEN